MTCWKRPARPPAPGGAGFIENANQRIVLQTEGQALTADQIGETIVVRGDRAHVRLRDVARVTVAPQPKYGDVLVQGRPGVLVKLLSQYGANTMTVTRSVEAALSEMQPMLDAEQIQIYPRLHRPATFIEVALAHITRSLYIGAALVVVVLALFLSNLRTALISIAAIPLSLLAAIVVMDWMGLSLNTITLGGLAIAIGAVVDDAIIDVENIFRRLRENHVERGNRSAEQVVLDASLEVRSAVVYATFVVVLVFVPVLTLSGLQGRMFAPLGVAYIAAIMASLVVALTGHAGAGLSAVAARRGAPAGGARSSEAPQAWLPDPAGVVHPLAARRSWWAVHSPRLGPCTFWRTSARSFCPNSVKGHFVVQLSSVPRFFAARDDAAGRACVSRSS